MQIAEEIGIPIEEKRFKTDDIYMAEEDFFCGTAVEVTAIRSLDDQVIAQGNIGKITEEIKSRYHQIIRGKIPTYHNALTWIPVKKEREIEA